MSRFKAASLHFALSVLVGAALLGAMLLLWYPAPFFEASGGNHLALLIIGIDVVLGPLMTLIVFDIRKKSLKFDMAAVLFIQAAALIYGTNIMFQARPAFVVYAVGVFRIAAANELEPELLAQAQHEEFRRPPLGGPQIVAAANPTDPTELSTVTFAALSGIDLHVLPKYYVPYADQRTDAARRGRPLAVLKAAAGEDAEAVDRFLAASGRREDSLRFLPLLAKARELTVLVDAESGDVVAILPLTSP